MIPIDFVSGGALLIIFGALLAYFRNLPGRIYSFVERFFITKLDIQEEDESFQWLKLWLSDILKKSLSVSVFTRRSGNSPQWEDDPAEVYKYAGTVDKRPVVVFTPAPGWYWFFFKGRFVTVTRDRTQPDGRGMESLKPRESFSIRVFTRNLQVAKELVETARDFALPSDGKIEIRTCGTGWTWTLAGRTRPRPIESVVLAGDTAGQIMADIRRFQNSADWYTRLGVPYRRGYLFYGEPGNGKTSMVLGIASELGMNVNILNLSVAGMDDGKIVELLSATDSNTIVLIEDIDCAFVKRKSGPDRKDKLTGLSFSGLLNALDGIIAQDGRIVCMTTNHPEKLDEALTRPGRADVKVYIGNASTDQLRRLFYRFYQDAELAEKFALSLPENKISMANVQHHLMTYRDDPKMAVHFAQNLVEHYEKIAA